MKHGTDKTPLVAQEKLECPNVLVHHEVHSWPKPLLRPTGVSVKVRFQLPPDEVILFFKRYGFLPRQQRLCSVAEVLLQ